MKRFLISKTSDAPAAAAAAAAKRAKSSPGSSTPAAAPPQLKLPRPRKIGHHDGLDVLYYPRFLNDGSITPALANLPLEESSILMFGKTVKEPRLTGFFSSNDRPLKYSRSIRHPLPLTEELDSIRRKIEELPDVQKALTKEEGQSNCVPNKSKYNNKNDEEDERLHEVLAMNQKSDTSSPSRYSFTGCFVNMYADGTHYMGFHSDDEAENGPSKDNRVIASVTLGEARRFVFKRKSDGTKVELMLEPGSLLFMKGRTQSIWKHAVPKTTKPMGKRLNLTYRVIL